MFKRKLQQFLAIPVFLIVAALFVGCGDDVIDGGSGNSGGSGTSSYVFSNFSTNPTELTKATETTVSGMVVDDSSYTGVEGLQIIFSVDPISAGYFTPAVDTTSGTGEFSTTFIPLDTGEVTIRVEISSVSQATSVSKTVAPQSGGFTTGDWDFKFEVSQSLILANGADNSNITVNINDASGSPVADGKEIHFEVGERFTDINNDGYFTENVDEVSDDINENEIWDKAGTYTNSAVTSGGSVTINFQAGTMAGLFYVRATVIDDSLSSPVYGEFPLALRPSSEIANLTLHTNQPEVQVRHTGGIEFTELIATGYDIYGNLVQQDLPVEFKILESPDGGEFLSSKVLDTIIESQYPYDTTIVATATTNVIGQAIVDFFSGTVSGTAKIQAYYPSDGDTTWSNKTFVNINAGPPKYLNVGVDPCNLPCWHIINCEADVVAIVSDTFTNPVADSTVIYFYVDEGMIEATGVTKNGIAGVTYYTTAPWDDGIVMINAETEGGTLSSYTSLLTVSGVPTDVNVLSYADTLYANGEDYSDILIDARDINNNFVVEGTEVEVLFSDGTTLNGSLQDGCYGSKVRLRYKAGTLNRDHEYSVPDNGIGRVVTGSIQAGGINGPSSLIQITLLTSLANTDQSDVKIEGTVSPGSTVPLDVVIRDRSGNPLGGHRIEHEANLGTIQPASAYTNAWGEAFFTYTAPPGIGNDFVTIKDMDDTYGGIYITKKVKIDLTD